MIRTFDPAPFARIIAHPDVRPWLGIVGDADLTPIVRNPDNFCLLTPEHGGGYILQRRSEGLYEAHTLAMPCARGRPMLRLMHAGFGFMFTATDALEITTMIPDGNVLGDRWAKLAGFREVFRREAFFPLEGQLVGGSFRTLGYADWVMRDPVNLEAGRAFHTLLTEGGFEPDHADDEAHEHWVGATMRAVVAGQPVKGVALYNRWASVAGYAPATLLAIAPPVVDIGTCVLGLVDHKPQVLCGPLRELAEGRATLPLPERSPCL